MLRSALLFQVRRHSSTLQCNAELHIAQHTGTLVTVLPQGNVELNFYLFFTALFNGGWRGECGRVFEIDDSCFSRWKCNCSRLRATVWFFVGVKRESGTSVLQQSLIALLRHCSPSLRHVSYPAPQLSVTAGGTIFVSAMMDSHTTPLIAGCWQIRSRPHGYTSRLTSGLTKKMKWNVW